MRPLHMPNIIADLQTLHTLIMHNEVMPREDLQCRGRVIQDIKVLLPRHMARQAVEVCLLHLHHSSNLLKLHIMDMALRFEVHQHP